MPDSPHNRPPADASPQSEGPGSPPGISGVTMTSAIGSNRPLPGEAPVEEIFLGDVPGHGERLGVRSVLGRGGMGCVVLATQPSLHREVAVKVLHDAPSAYAKQSLLREAQVVSRLEHPNIVPIYALGVDDRGRPALVMKRIEGVPWGTLIKDQGHHAWAAWQGQERDQIGAHVRILLAVCEAIQLAHSRGVVHRDIKPDNVMLGEFGEVYVTDWGIAVTRGEPTPSDPLVVGTTTMMAPEMLSGDPAKVDERTDVYLLGSTLHVALTGRPRHEGVDHDEVLRRVEASEPAVYPASIPPELASICNRATAGSPAERFASVGAFRQSLLDFLAHRSSLELSTAASERLATLRELVERSCEPGLRLAEEETNRLQQAGSESRFGYEMALRSWPDNEVARRGIEETLALLALYELMHGSLTAGRRHMASLRASDERLRQALALREQREREGEQRAERLARIEAEFDLSTEARNRRAMLVLILLPGVVLTFVLALTLLRTQRTISVEAMLLNNTVVLLLMSVYTLVYRKAVLSTAINQRVVGFLFAIYVSIFAHRLVSVSTGTPVTGVINGDIAILLAGTATGTIGITRSLWPAPAVVFIGTLTGALFPSLHIAASAISALFALGSIAFVWGRLSGSSLPGVSGRG